jgi:hypothetical protein
VVAVNPTATRTSKSFQRAAEILIRVRIEQLPSACRGFDLILENYRWPDAAI